MHASGDDDIGRELVLLWLGGQNNIESIAKRPFARRHSEVRFPAHDHSVLLAWIVDFLCLTREVLQLVSRTEKVVKLFISRTTTFNSLQPPWQVSVLSDSEVLARGYNQVQLELLHVVTSR